MGHTKSIYCQTWAPKFAIGCTYADRINHMHMKDGSGRFPDFAFPPLGRGDIDFQGLVSALRRSGYTGAYSVEYEAQVFGFQADEATILASGLEFLKSLDELR